MRLELPSKVYRPAGGGLPLGEAVRVDRHDGERGALDGAAALEDAQHVARLHDLEPGERVHWDVLPHVQVSLSRRQHILINGGVRIPVNDRQGRTTRVLTYFLWDWFDGGLLDGWR